MGEVYFQRDIERALKGIAAASGRGVGLAREMLYAMDEEELAEERMLEGYQRGVRDALFAVGMVFGVVDGVRFVDQEELI